MLHWGTDDEHVWNKEFADVRATEIRAVLAQVGPMISEAIGSLEAVETAEKRAVDETVPSILLKSLDELTAAADRVESTRKAIAIYLATQSHVAQREIARHLNVAPTTVYRWIREERDGDTPLRSTSPSN